MKTLSTLWIFVIGWICLSTGALGQQAPTVIDRYALAEILLPDHPDWDFLLRCGIDPDHGMIRGTESIITPIPHSALATLREHGYTVRIWINDLTRYYQERNQHLPPVILSDSDPPQFQLGSMGGFYRYAEVWEQFDRMLQQYPALISGPDTIGWSIEQRPILLYRIGTDSAFATDHPEVLYTAVHHAREPGGITTIVYFLWWLFEHYEQGDAEIRYLLNHRQIFVVPMVNPDGYVFNEQTEPKGGGMWRKNRREVAPNIYGVDLNRNYGPQELWDAPEGGSSDDPASQTYRGTAPFSEPETQAIRDLCLEHHFAVAFNYHTFSNLYIYPWGAWGRETKDSLWFRSFSRYISKDNHYCFGLDYQTVGYRARGVSDDWMYYELDEKPSIFSFTPEVGTIIDGFWPPKDRILPLARENVIPNLQLLWSAAANLRPIAFFPEDTTARFCLEVQNIGRESSEDSTAITIQLQSRNQLIAQYHRTVPDLSPAAIWRDTLDLTTDLSTVATGDSVAAIVTVWQHSIPRRDTFWFRNPVGAQYRWLFRSGTDAPRWRLDQWGIEIDSIRGAVLSDSPKEVYQNDTTVTLQLRSPIDLTQVSGAVLSFWTRWAIEPSFDFATIEVSTDGGSTWHSLRSRRMDRSLGAPWGRQNDSTQWGFEGFFPFWIYQHCDLTPFIGHQLLLRFQLKSDNFFAMDGWLLDDLLLTLFPLSPTTVDAPVAIHPAIRYQNRKVFITELPAHARYTFQLYSLTGKKLIERPVSAPAMVIPLPPLPAGSYIIMLKSLTATEDPTATRILIGP